MLPAILVAFLAIGGSWGGRGRGVGAKPADAGAPPQALYFSADNLTGSP